MGKFSRLGNDLYTGRRSWDFVHRQLVWYTISIILVLGSAGVLIGKGLNLGIEFTGGTQITATFKGATTADVTQDGAEKLRTAVEDSGIVDGDVVVTTKGSEAYLVQTPELSQSAADQLIDEVRTDVLPSGDDPSTLDLSTSEIGASLGAQLAQRAAIGVGVFLILVVLFIWAYFRELKMSLAALVALFHDIMLTVGVYALSGFSVTPAAVTGLLAILGFSLYDTVVVFDKVRENTKNLRNSRTTYAEAANLAVNQTLVRSINTAIVALIPIGAILYVSAAQLGASSLQDLALSQFVGMGVGVYSSIFLAPRVLVRLKSNETEVKLAEKRAKARARSQADRYATVPAFTDDLPVRQNADDDLDPDDENVIEIPDEDNEPTSPARPTTPSRPTAAGSGRTVPPSRGPMGRSNSAGRQQPSRKPKSQRGK